MCVNLCVLFFQAEEVLRTCVKVTPRHGELWCSIAKQTTNRRKPIEEVLPLVAEAFPSP